MLAFESHGVGGAPIVLLLHGWPFRAPIWRDVGAGLAPRGFRMIAPDLPGFGDSPALDKDPPTTEAYADAVAGLLRALGRGSVAVAGHSFGGYVALALADLYPDLVSGLALVSSRTRADPDAARRGRFEAMTKVRAGGTQALLPSLADKLLGPRSDSRLRDRVRAEIVRARPDGTIAGLAAMASRPDRTSVLETFSGPVLVVHGTTDALVPIAEAARPGPHQGPFERTILPDVGHMPMWEAPDALLEAIVRWASRALRAGT